MSIVKYNSVEFDDSFKTITSLNTSLNNAVSSLGGCYGAEGSYVNISEAVSRINECTFKVNNLNSWLTKTNTDVTNALNSFKNDYNNMKDVIVENRKNAVNFR